MDEQKRRKEKGVESVSSKSGYEDKIQPYLQEIKAMVDAELHEKKIAIALGVGVTSFRRYKREHPELAAVLARPDNYTKRVKPHLHEIPEWSITMTNGQIAAKLGVSRSAWDDYINQHQELKEALKTGNELFVKELRNAMRKKAFGFSYTEKKTTQRKGSDGKMQAVIETFERESLPDVVALHLLLKNNDPEWRNEDFETMELKKKQLDIAQQKADEQTW